MNDTNKLDEIKCLNMKADSLNWNIYASISSTTEFKEFIKRLNLSCTDFNLSYKLKNGIIYLNVVETEDLFLKKALDKIQKEEILFDLNFIEAEPQKKDEELEIISKYIYINCSIEDIRHALQFKTHKFSEYRIEIKYEKLLNALEEI